jgi:hypothetical protein
MHGTEVEESRLVVFDVSLLAPHLQDLLQALIVEGNLTFVATPRMQGILKEIEGYKCLLKLWNIDTRYARSIADFLRQTKLVEKVKVIACEELPEYKVWGYLKDAIVEKEITSDILADLVADEMCLAIAGFPILCSASSHWKIVEFFKKIGVSVRKIIRARIKEKGEMLRTKKFRLMVLAKGLRIAFIYVIKVPLDVFAQFGLEMISLIIVNG